MLDLLYIVGSVASVLGLLHPFCVRFYPEIRGTVRGALPAIFFLAAGVVLASNLPHISAFLAPIHQALRQVLVTGLIFVGVLLLIWATKKGVGDSLPALGTSNKALADATVQLEAARAFQQAVGSLTVEHQSTLEILAKWTRSNPRDRVGMFMSGDEGTSLTALHGRAPTPCPDPLGAT